MKKLSFMLVSLVLLVAACESVDVSKMSDADLQRLSEKAVVCNTPYIRFGTTCCLSTIKEGICDRDIVEDSKTEPKDNSSASNPIPEPIQETKPVPQPTPGQVSQTEPKQGIDVPSIILRGNGKMRYEFGFAPKWFIVTNPTAGDTIILGLTKLQFAGTGPNGETILLINDASGGELFLKKGEDVMSSTADGQLQIYLDDSGSVNFKRLTNPLNAPNNCNQYKGCAGNQICKNDKCVNK